MNFPLSSASSGTPPSEPPAFPLRPAESRARAYEPPCIEDDLALEVMSLACTGFRPKSAQLHCVVLGS